VAEPAIARTMVDMATAHLAAQLAGRVTASGRQSSHAAGHAGLSAVGQFEAV